MPPITPRRESFGFTDNPCLAVDVRHRFLACGAPSYAEGYMPRSMLVAGACCLHSMRCQAPV